MGLGKTQLLRHDRESSYLKGRFVQHALTFSGADSGQSTRGSAHRFDDLIRELIYDFRDWQSIEATGKGGSDDGFDIRLGEHQ
jgi:hypothetical protein